MNVVIKLRGATSDITSDKLNYCIDNKWGETGTGKKKNLPLFPPINDNHVHWKNWTNKEWNREAKSVTVALAFVNDFVNSVGHVNRRMKRRSRRVFIGLSCWASFNKRSSTRWKWSNRPFSFHSGSSCRHLSLGPLLASRYARFNATLINNWAAARAHAWCKLHQTEAVYYVSNVAISLPNQLWRL